MSLRRNRAIKDCKSYAGFLGGGGGCAARARKPKRPPRGAAVPNEKSPRTGYLMAFAHPLARAAKIWTARGADDSEQRVLVIVTTIPLDTDHKGYKKSLVEKLTRAAHEYLAGSKEAESFVLINRLRDWGSAKA